MCSNAPKVRTPSAVIMVIIDGLSDIAALPQSSTLTPTLDQAASRGRSGLIDPVRPGLACGSDTAHLAIFGYNPILCYRGRGAFEALGAGVDVQEGDIAFKCNFARMDDGTGIVTSRCASRTPEMHLLGKRMAVVLERAARERLPEVRTDIVHVGKHRCVVCLSGNGLSDNITNTDPLIDNRPLQTCVTEGKRTEASVRTSRIVNKLTSIFREELRSHPANLLPGVDGPATNVLLLRGAAERVTIPKFDNKYDLRTFLIAPTEIVAGVGRAAGIEMLAVEGATGGYDTNLQQKAAACVKAIMTPHYQFGYKYSLGIVHVKAVDEAAHEQDVEKKAHWMQNVDNMIEHILGLLKEGSREDVTFLVTGDHTTACAYGDHTCEPVPILLFDMFDPKTAAEYNAPAFIHSDRCTSFRETLAGADGSLGRFPALEIPKIIVGIIHGRCESR